jgi:Zn finger protein HypA/HybF involved in hydrogenase expression
MEKKGTSLTFSCPKCKATFEFDFVDEYQYVPCPICGIELMTIRKDQTLLLEPFEFDQKNPASKMQPVIQRRWS